MNAGEIVAHLKARADEFRAGMRSAREDMDRLRKNAMDNTRKLAETGKKMTKYITLPILAVGAMAIRTAGKFEESMNKVSALSGATGESLDRLKDLAMTMGRETRYSASEAADGLSFLAMAGFDVDQSISALPSVLEMAAAGGMDLAQAADYASNILTGFGLEAEEMGRVTDVLALTFTSSNTNLSQLAEGMKYAAPIAAGLGMEVEEVAAAMGMMGDAGIQGSMAGTTLRQSMMQLMTPTGAAVDVIERLGLEINDTEGEFVGLVDIVKQLEDSGASTQDMMELFGARGAGMIALVQQGSEKFAEFNEELENADGTGRRISEVMLEGLMGRLTILRGSVETLLIVIGERFLPRLTEWVEKGIDLINTMSEWSDATWNTIAVLGTLLAVMGPLVMVYAKVKMFTLQWAAAKAIATKAVTTNTAAVMYNNVAVNTSMTRLGALSGKLLAFAAKAGPIALVAGAVAGLGYLVKSTFDNWVVEQGDAEVELAKSMERIKDGYSQTAAGIAETEAERRLDEITAQLEHFEEMNTLTSEQLAEREGLHEEFAMTLEQIERSRHAQEIVAQREAGIALASEAGTGYEAVEQVFEDYRGNLDEAARTAYQREVDAAIEQYVELGEISEAEFRNLLHIAEGNLEEMERQNQGKMNELGAMYTEELIKHGLIWDKEMQEIVEIAAAHSKSALQGAADIMADGQPLWKRMGYDSAHSYSMGLRDGTQPAEEAVKELARRTEQACKMELGMRSPSTVFIGIGQGIVQGLINGMRGMLGSLRSAAVDVVSNAYNAAKNWLQSKSPSRKTMELGGDWTGGIVKGMLADVKAVQQAAQSVVDSSLNVNTSISVAGVQEATLSIRHYVDLVNIPEGVDSGSLKEGLERMLNTPSVRRTLDNITHQNSVDASRRRG